MQNKGDFGKIILLLQELTKTDISVFDPVFLRKSIDERISVNKVASFTEYLDYLKRGNDEASNVINSLKNCYTEFFRDTITLSILEKYIFPGLFDSYKKRGNEIRIWSAGCSSGQEAYTLAIIANDFIEKNKIKSNFRIFATDNSQKELDAARTGIFNISSMQNVKFSHLNAYFTAKAENYAIREDLKKHIEFSYYNLLDFTSTSPPSSIFGDFDIVVCSNVLIYYKEEVRKQILSKLCNSMKNDGFLITGEAEASLFQSFCGCKQYSVPTNIFKKQQME